MITPFQKYEFFYIALINDIIFEYLNKIGFDVNNPYFFETKKEVIYANYVDKN